MANQQSGAVMATYNQVMRVDPNSMQRVGRSVMEGGYLRGNQRPHVVATNRLSAPTLSVASPLHSQQPEPPDEPTFVPIDDKRAPLLVEPSNRVVLRSAEPVRLTVARSNAQDIEWRAYSPRSDDLRIMRTGKVRFIVDRPIVDTMYEVRYKYPERLATGALRWHVESFYVLLRVVESNGSQSDASGASSGPALHFALSERRVDAANNVVSFVFALSNRTSQTLRDIDVELTAPPYALFDAVASRRAVPESSVRWSHENQPHGSLLMEADDYELESVPVATTRVALLEAGATVRFAYSVRAKYAESNIAEMHIDDASVWSERTGQNIFSIALSNEA